MNKYRFYIIGLFASFAFFQSFFWDTVYANNTWKTSDIPFSSLVQVELWYQTQTFSIWNLYLKDILKIDLNPEQTAFIENQILSYTRQIQNMVIEVSEDYKKNVLQLQQDFYISLLPYIETSKIQDFKTVVSQKAITFEKNILSSSPDIQTLPRSEATLLIETQVQKNNELIRSQMQEWVLDHIRVKVDAIVLQEKFQALPAEIKKDLFHKFSSKLALKLDELQKLQNPTRIIEEKVFLYHAILELLQSYIDTWDI